MTDIVAEPFEIMAKPVCGRCNLNCGYCYYTSKGRQLYPDEPEPMMSDALLAEFVRQYTAANPEFAEFCWQGGEPLLAGKDFFRSVVKYQQQFGRSGQRIGNALQTNGILLDDEWCEFFAGYRFLVGISVDGPAQFHDIFRRDHAGRGSFDRAWRGVNLLAKHNVQFNVLTTLNQRNVKHGADIYRFFVNRGVRFLQFIPILERTSDGRPTDFSCPPDALGRFMLDVFDLWVKQGVGTVSERLIDSTLNVLVVGRASVCWNMPQCPKAFVLEWNGDVYVCDHFVYRQWRMGNILQNALTELANVPLYDEFVRTKTELPDVCKDCEYLSYCYAGCPKQHIGAADRLDPARVNYFCDSYKLFFRHALPELKRIAARLTKPVGRTT